MKSYPKIINRNAKKAQKNLNQDCIAFNKYDGSNLRFEWDKKLGFNKFGSRTRTFDKTDNQFGGAIDLFFEEYAEDIERKIVDVLKPKENVTAYMEYYGFTSFAGQHNEADEKYLTLFDINIYKKGIISPYKFVDIFGDLSCSAEVIYEGKFNEEFIDSILNDTTSYEEGIIAKGGEGHKLWMVKVKTLQYLERLKKQYGEDYWKYWE